METGTVKWFNDQKGYGFIQPDQGGKDVFVHVSAVERSGIRGLVEGQKISYEIQERSPHRQVFCCEPAGRLRSFHLHEDVARLRKRM